MKSPLLGALPLTVLLLPLTPLQAAGFAIAEQSGSGLGNAYASGAATHDDASVVWFNPAAMNELDAHKQHVTGVINIVQPKVTFSNEGSRVNPALTGGNIAAAETALTGTHGNSENLAAVPNLYWVKPLNERIRLGIGLNAPFGSVIEYNEDWYGRYHAVKTDLKTININPSLSYQLNNRTSIGAGLNVQYAQVELTAKVDSAATCLGQAISTSNLALQGQCLGTYGTTVSHAATDSEAIIKGDDTGYGFNIGIMHKPSERTHIGAHYRSKVKYDIAGQAKYNVHSGLASIIDSQSIDLLRDEAVIADMTVPESLSVSLVHQLNPRWDIMADWTHTRWDHFQELKITAAETGNAISRVDQSWKNSNRYALGANYHYDPKLTLRAGVALDETPVPDAEHRTARTPAIDRTWLSLGANYQLSKKSSLDLGFTHVMMDKAATDSTDELSGYRLQGEFDNSVNVLSAQLNWAF